MKYLVILFLICGVLIFPAEEKKSDPEKKQLMQKNEKEKKTEKAPTTTRDPFTIFTDKKKEVRRPRGNTIESFTIDEVKVEGIIKMKDGKFKALLAAPRGKSFVVTVGQKLYDGEIVKITIRNVFFRENSTYTIIKK